MKTYRKAFLLLAVGLLLAVTSTSFGQVQCNAPAAAQNAAPAQQNSVMQYTYYSYPQFATTWAPSRRVYTQQQFVTVPQQSVFVTQQSVPVNQQGTFVTQQSLGANQQGLLLDLLFSPLFGSGLNLATGLVGGQRDQLVLLEIKKHLDELKANVATGPVPAATEARIAAIENYLKGQTGSTFTPGVAATPPAGGTPIPSGIFGPIAQQGAIVQQNATAVTDLSKNVKELSGEVTKLTTAIEAMNKNKPDDKAK